MKRRGVLGAILALAGSAAVARPWRRPRRLRPPGARAESEFERRCIRCFRCAEVCPPKCLRFDSLFDWRSSDTPYIDAATRACVLCMKCTQVCPTDALEPIEPDLRVMARRVRMGRPVLDRSRCIAWNGQGLCRLCYYACPYPDRAVAVVGPRQAPAFDPAACVGCGLCEEACPHHARAIHIEPIEEGT